MEKQSFSWFNLIIPFILFGIILQIHSIIYFNTIQLTKIKESNVDSSMNLYYLFSIIALIGILLISQTQSQLTIIHKIIAILYSITLGGFFYANYYSGNAMIQDKISQGGSAASIYESTDYKTIITISIGTIFTAILALIPLFLSIGTIQSSFGNSLLQLFQGDIFSGVFLVLFLPIGLLPLLWYQFGMNVNGRPFTIGVSLFSAVFWLGSLFAISQVF
jgi:hypothetical protein